MNKKLLIIPAAAVIFLVLAMPLSEAKDPEPTLWVNKYKPNVAKEIDNFKIIAQGTPECILEPISTADGWETCTQVFRIDLSAQKSSILGNKFLNEKFLKISWRNPDTVRNVKILYDPVPTFKEDIILNQTCLDTYEKGEVKQIVETDYKKNCEQAIKIPVFKWIPIKEFKITEDYSWFKIEYERVSYSANKLVVEFDEKWITAK